LSHLRSWDSPKSKKQNNPYAFKDALGYIESRRFRTRGYRDEYTGSRIQYVDRARRTFYEVQAEGIEPGSQPKPHAG
jgi:hypothetical protein